MEVGGQVDGQQTHPPSRKSLSCERTFKAEFSAVELRNRLKELCRQVAEDTWHCVLSIPGPFTILGAKWGTIFEGILINHHVGLNWHPLEGAESKVSTCCWSFKTC